MITIGRVGCGRCKKKGHIAKFCNDIFAKVCHSKLMYLPYLLNMNFEYSRKDRFDIKSQPVAPSSISSFVHTCPWLLAETIC